jgi:hypothetical protein
MTSFAQYGPGREELPANIERGILRRNATNDGWEQKPPENILSDAAGDISINNHRLINIAVPTSSTDAATQGYADSIGVNSVNRATYNLIDSTTTTGTNQPLPLNDSLFTGVVPGGSIAGAGVQGVVAVSFSSVGDETGTGTGEGGLGSSPNFDQPYNKIDFPGQHNVPVQIATSDGTLTQVSDVISSPPIGQDAQEVFGILSYRSDLGTNLKWRLWFYYRRTSDGAPVSFTPDISLNNVSLYVAVVGTLATIPVGSSLGKISTTAAASGVVPGLLSDIKDVDDSNAAGSSGRFADASHIHDHGQHPAGSQGGLSHGLADASNNGFISPSQFSKLESFLEIIDSYMVISGGLFPTSVTWFTSVGSVKLKESLFTRNSRNQPTTIVTKSYSNGVLVQTLTDTVTYNGVFEASRIRVVS